MRKVVGIELAGLFDGEAAEIWADRVARRSVLRGLVPDGHRVLDEEDILLAAAEDDLREQAGPALRRRDLAGPAERRLLALCARYLRGYGVSAAALPARLDALRREELARLTRAAA